MDPLIQVNTCWSASTHKASTNGPIPVIAFTSVSFPPFQFPLAPCFSSSFGVFSSTLSFYQIKACFCMAEESLRIVCSTHFYFRNLVCTASRFFCVRLHSSSLEITLGQYILAIFLTHLPFFKRLQVAYN